MKSILLALLAGIVILISVKATLYSQRLDQPAISSPDRSADGSDSKRLVHLGNYNQTADLPTLAGCEKEMTRFCKGVPAGEGRVRDCLFANLEKIGTECKAALDKIAPRTLNEGWSVPSSLASCATPIREFCAETKLGEYRLQSCLLRHMDQLNADCKALLMEGTEEKTFKEGWSPAGSLSPCVPLIAKYCAEVKTGGGRIKKCLNSHKNSLEPKCEKALSALGD